MRGAKLWVVHIAYSHPSCTRAHTIIAYTQHTQYIDPSYLIRSIPTTTNDRIYCKVGGPH